MGNIWDWEPDASVFVFSSRFFVLSSRFSWFLLVDRISGCPAFGRILHEQSITRKENLCDFERAAAFVSSGVAVSEIDLGSGLLVFARRHPSGKLGRIACASGGKSVGNGAGSDSVA